MASGSVLEDCMPHHQLQSQGPVIAADKKILDPSQLADAKLESSSAPAVAIMLWASLKDPNVVGPQQSLIHPT